MKIDFIFIWSLLLTFGMIFMVILFWLRWSKSIKKENLEKVKDK